MELLRPGRESFDAVLMDVQMPVMDGYQATREIRETLGEKSLPIIAMTANAFQWDRQRCLDAGLNDHLSKPIDVEKLVETLGRYCRLDPAGEGACDPHPPVPDPEAPLPGLDLRDTLRRLNGNRVLYGQIAGMTCNRYAQVGEQLAGLLDGGDRTGAGELLHTLKGVVVNMGAFPLAESIRSLEDDLKGEEGGARLAESLDRFHLLLAEAFDSLAIVAERFAEPAPQQGGASAQADPELAAGELRRLMALLEESNLKSVDAFACFGRRFGTLAGERLDPLREAVENLDFAAALQLSRHLLRVWEEGDR